jgi:hypothetical protein
MRSDLVFGALTYVPNRYLLTRLASRAARKLHKPGVRIEDTTNDVLVRFGCANPMAPEPVPREPPKVLLRAKMKSPAFPDPSEVVVLPSSRENSTPLTKRSHSGDNSLAPTLGFHTYSDIHVS